MAILFSPNLVAENSAPPTTGTIFQQPDGKWALSTPDGIQNYDLIPRMGLMGDIFQGGLGGMSGKHAQVVLFPQTRSTNGPGNYQVHIPNSDNKHIIRAHQGVVILDKSEYQSTPLSFREGTKGTLYSEKDNADIENIEYVLKKYQELFPFKRLPPQINVVSAQSAREDFFHGGPSIQYGGYGSTFDTPEGLTVVLGSENGRGKGVISHRLHEFAHLFSINPPFAHGMTWFVAFDQGRSLQSTGPIAGLLRDIAHPAFPEKSFQQHLDLLHSQRQKGLLNSEMIGKLNPYDAHLAGALWLALNDQLKKEGAPTLYDLINYIHKHPPSSGQKGPVLDDLEALIEKYKKMQKEFFPTKESSLAKKHEEFFEMKIRDYFQSPLKVLLTTLEKDLGTSLRTPTGSPALLSTSPKKTHKPN